MSDLVPAFELTWGSNGILADAMFRFAIGVVGLIVGVWTFRSRRTNDGFLKRLIPAVFTIGWSLVWLGLHMPVWKIATIDMYRLLSVYRSGHAEITEGVVHVTRQQPAHGHSSGDRIVIGDRMFEIDYFHVTPGYRQTIAHGGVLREGVFARLHHHDGVILKVEVSKGAP